MCNYDAMVVPTFRTYCAKIDGYCNGTKYDCAACHMRPCPKGGMANCSVNDKFCKICQSQTRSACHPNHPINTWGYNLFGDIGAQ
jgi:hypothetical protein